MSEVLSSHLSLYSIPVVWLTALAPAVLRTRSIGQSVGFNNVQPRANIARLATKKNVSDEMAARIARMDGAHANGNEIFPLWAASILAANFAGVDNRTLNVTSLAFIALRVLYNYIYINQKTRVQSLMRTGVFTVSVSLPLFLLIKAASMPKEGRTM